MHQKQRQRKLEGKKSVFTIRGRRVNAKKLEKLTLSNGIQWDSHVDSEPTCEFRGTSSAMISDCFDRFTSTYKMLDSNSIAKTARH